MASEPPPRSGALILRIARFLRRAAAAVAAVMNSLAGWVFILCSVFVSLDVLFRNFGGFSSRATTEITSYMLAFGIAWGLAHALAARAHIRIDVLVNRLPVRQRQYLHAFALAVLTGLSLFMTWCAWMLVDESALFNATDTSALAIPLALPQGLWAAGITMLAVMSVLLLIEVASLLLAGEPEEIDSLLGPRGYREETEETLRAAALTKVAAEGRGGTS